MSEEILDIVDEMDLVIGSATRGEVHSSGLLHRSAHLLVFDGNGMVILHNLPNQRERGREKLAIRRKCPIYIIK